MLRTLGHATLALYQRDKNPILVTDPWLIGSVYWRSWWLENYPTTEEIDWLARTAFVYVTHEHPDHFHMPTIRRLGHGPTYLFPALAEQGYLEHMARHGFRAEAATPLQWREIADGIWLMSVPAWNDDSVMLIDTPDALIVNLNDAKLLKPVLRAIRRIADNSRKPRILLCSYSPASVINSFLDDSGVVSLKPARHYVDYVCRVCELLAVDIYMPFASQAIFNRLDSCWANDYRTTYRHLQQYWRARTQLVPPYTTLNLRDLSYCSTAPERYRPKERPALDLQTARRAALEETATISCDDVSALQRKLNAFRSLLALILPRGFAFRLGERCFHYNGWRGRLIEVDPFAGPYGDFIVTVPKLTIKEAIANNHVSDLGITMFIRIRLLRRIDPRKAYALFVLFQFDDYGHLRSLAALSRWLWRGVRFTLALRLPAAPSSAARQ